MNGKIPKKAHNMVEKVRTVTSLASSYDGSPSTIISAKHCVHVLLLALLSLDYVASLTLNIGIRVNVLSS